MKTRERYALIAQLGRPVPEADADAPLPAEIALRLGYRHEDIAAVPAGANLGLGCGTPVACAALRAGETVLDVGCGPGFDAILAARAVGPTGRVIAVDMVPEMIALARQNADAACAFHVELREGLAEALPVADESVDVVISNNAINLVPDKVAVYREVLRVLRPGGRVVVCDTMLDRALPAEGVASAILAGSVVEVATRADYLAVAAAVGLEDVCVLKEEPFGAMELALIPEHMRHAVGAGVVDAIARAFRSVTLCARRRAQ